MKRDTEANSKGQWHDRHQVPDQPSMEKHLLEYIVHGERISRMYSSHQEAVMEWATRLRKEAGVKPHSAKVFKIRMLSAGVMI